MLHGVSLVGIHFGSACVQVCCVALESDAENRFHRCAEHSEWGVIMIRNTILNSSLILMLFSGATYAGSEVGNSQRRGSIPCGVLDRNQDGLVSRQEYGRLRDERRATRTQRGDPARGGNIEARFERMDSNGDNLISRDEFVAHQAQRMHQRQARQRRYVE